MINAYSRGKEPSDEYLQQRTEELYSKVLGHSIKKYLLLSLWLLFALIVSGTVASAANSTGEFNFIASAGNLIAALIAIGIFFSAYVKYLVVEPAAIFLPEKIRLISRKGFFGPTGTCLACCFFLRH